MVGGKRKRKRNWKNDRLVAVLDCLGDPAAVVGMDRVIIAANCRYRERYLAGSSYDCCHCYEVTHGYSRPCDGENEPCPIQRSLESGWHCQVQHTHVGSHGEHRVTVSVQPIRDSKERIAGFFQTLRSTPSSLLLWTWPILRASPAFNRLLHFLEAVAPISVPVLLRGEAGSGRELVARSLHESSPQRKELFVPMDCTGLSEVAFEKSFFAWQTVANSHTFMTGRVDSAPAGGTIFLNEVGDLTPSSQVKLLFMMERGWLSPDDSQRHGASTRLVFSTRYELQRKVDEGLFNRDLFHLMSRYSIEVPPLREYLPDLPIFVLGLLQHLSGGRVSRIASSSLSLLQQYSFPGNVRELVSVLEYACLCADGNTIFPQHLPLECRGDTVVQTRPEGWMGRLVEDT